jgi:hypothetical protein
MSNKFICMQTGTADEGEYGGRWNQLLCYPWASPDVNSLQVIPARTGYESPKDYGYRFTLTSTLTLDEVGGLRQAPAALPQRKRPGTHCTGGWVVPQRESGGTRKFSPKSGFDLRNTQPVANTYNNWATPAPLYIVYSIQMLCIVTTYSVPTAPDLREPNNCASTGVSVVSLMQISYMVLLCNRCTGYHRM